MVHPAPGRRPLRSLYEDILDVYCRPYDPRYPVVVTNDEASKQLLGDVREPLPMSPEARACRQRL